MKIEPVSLFLHDKHAGYTQIGEWDEQIGELMGLSKEEWYTDAVPLYSESQMRQLGEACAEVVNKADPYGDTITEIRELIKELLP